MSKATEQRRIRWGYETDTPRCSGCRSYRKARMPAPDKLDPPYCVAGKWVVEPTACCDHFVDRKTGERLA